MSKIGELPPKEAISLTGTIELVHGDDGWSVRVGERGEVFTFPDWSRANALYQLMVQLLEEDLGDV